MIADQKKPTDIKKQNNTCKDIYPYYGWVVIGQI